MKVRKLIYYIIGSVVLTVLVLGVLFLIVQWHTNKNFTKKDNIYSGNQRDNVYDSEYYDNSTKNQSEKDAVDKALKEIYYPQDGDIRLFTTKLIGDFAIGYVNFKIGGGYRWWARQKDQRWEIFLETQEEPFCSILQKNNVPNSFYSGNCYLNDSAILIPYKG